jgi:uncharacterized protein
MNVRRAAAAVLLALLGIASAACRTATPSSAIPAGNPGSAEAGTILPRPDRLVTDSAGVLSAEDISALERELLDVKQRRLAEMLIYIVPSLPPGEILEDLTLRSVNAWGVGSADSDNGLVIFVFITERLVRIELGFGLESAISNRAAARVIAENIAPSFRRKAYREGLHSAVQELSRLLNRRNAIASAGD